ncbi:MAG: transglycosylase SLT domain-containing protein [Alphaproteobacteria bacterium]
MQLARFISDPDRARGWLAAFLAVCILVLPAPGNAGQATNKGAVVAISAVPVVPALDSNGLPRVLSDRDVGLYREIFALQIKGKWRAADQRIARLSDRSLLGHLLSQRYLHPTAYRSKYKELRDWMAHYADHPDARRIYKLALKRRPKNYKYPARPAARPSGPAMSGGKVQKRYRSTKRLSKAERRQAAQLKRQIRRNVLRTRLSVTEKLLAGAKAKHLLDRVERDDGLSQVAAAWFYYGNIERAFKLADGAARRSGEHLSMAHWIAGLAAWRQGRIEIAAGHFEKLAVSRAASGWTAASGAYWAARAHLRLRHPAQMSRWLTLAAGSPRTFYGLLAQRALGIKLRFDRHAHALQPADVAELAAEARSARAMALLQVGQRLRAERELKNLNGGATPAMTQALLAFADHARMPGLAFRLGHRLAASELPEPSLGSLGILDGALYPIPPWRPKGGFTVDRALIFALVRQESGFNPNAKSRDGARGLMQLMPSTASFIARDRGFRRRKRNQLFDPETNLDLGQRYLSHLLADQAVGGNLFLLTTAYNGGPGNLNKWRRKMDYRGDPLMFIESLPSRETRLFIERVLANLWIYRARLGQPAPSLDGIASGDWPLYVAMDSKTQELAVNPAGNAARNANEPN